MVTSSAVVGSSASSSLGCAGDRGGDHHPLAHAAGQAGAGTRRCASPGWGCPPAAGAGCPSGALHGRRSCRAAQAFGDLVADAPDRVEAGHRVLEDHGDLYATDALHLAFGERQQVPAVEADLAAGDVPGGRGDQAQDGAAQHRFAAARFAHDAQRLAARQGDGHVLVRQHPARLAAELGV